MLYKDLDLKINQDVKYTIINNKEIQVKQYLPIKDKNDLIEIALQKSKENNVYNEIKLDMYFNLNIVMLYTDLVFTPEELEDEMKLYDELQSNDVFLSVIGAMREEEYDSLLDYLKIMKEANETHDRSAAAMLKTFTQDLPKNAAAAADIMNNFNKEDYSEVINFAEAANGNRPIPLVED